MKTINVQELEEVIKGYVNKEISTPLIVFGKDHLDARRQIVMSLFGDVNFWKINYPDDNPTTDMPFCLFDTYMGEEYTDSVLRNCFTIAKVRRIPVFCFLHSGYIDKIPEDITKDLDLYVFEDD